MKVSVIVPLFNKRPYVLRCLDSIAGQSFSDWEAIVVDDGSTDGSGDLVATYPDPRFRLIRQPNAGPGAARNRALAEAQGEYAAFLDADDIWLPEYLETMAGILDREAPAVAAVTCGYSERPKGISREPMWRARGIAEGIQKAAAVSSPLALHYILCYMTPCSTVARIETVRQWGGFFDKTSCRFGEDQVLWTRMLLNHPAYFLLRPLVVIDRGASSLSSTVGGARPLEPFLEDAGAILAHCPAQYLKLAKGLLAIRAYKAAAMLGYWGDHRAAWRVFRRFMSWGDWGKFYFWAGLAGSTRIGGWLGWCWRAHDFRASRIVVQAADSPDEAAGFFNGRPKFRK